MKKRFMPHQYGMRDAKERHLRLPESLKKELHFGQKEMVTFKGHHPAKTLLSFRQIPVHCKSSDIILQFLLLILCN